MSSLGVSLLNDDATDSQPQHRNFSTRPEQRSDDQAEVTWSDYWRLLTDRQLLPIYALSLCVLATKQLDDNLSLLLSQGACIEEGVTAELCRHQDQLSASTEWHDASLRIAQRAAKLASYGQTGNQLCQMLTMLFLGAASDRIGRKPVLQVVLFGCFLDYALIATVKHLDALVALHAVTGVLCGPMFQAYAVMIATDLTTAQDRMLTMAMMHGLMFGAGAGAPICIGGLVKLLTTSSRGYLEALRFTFGVGSVIILCALLYVRLRFVESLQVAKSEHERERGHDGTQCMRFTSAVLRKGNPMSMWQLLAETREYTIIPTLVTAIFAINHFASGASVLVPLYTEHMFGWEAFEMGIFKSVGGILNIFASLVLLPALVICFGERRAAITMMCFGLSGFVLMGFSGVAAVATVPGDGSTADTLPADAGAGRWAREACMVVGFPLHNMWFNVGTIYTAIGTQAVDTNMIASILSLWQFLNTFALMLSPMLFRWIYSASVSSMPGLIWFTESGLFLVGFACFFALPDWTKPVHAARGGGYRRLHDSQRSLQSTPADTEKLELIRHAHALGGEE